MNLVYGNVTIYNQKIINIYPNIYYIILFINYGVLSLKLNEWHN